MAFGCGASKCTTLNSRFSPKTRDFVDLLQQEACKTRMFCAKSAFEVNKVRSFAHSVSVRNDSSDKREGYDNG
jgi:hypothetical protein